VLTFAVLIYCLPFEFRLINLIIIQVYQFGYTNGIAFYAKNPQKAESDLIANALGLESDLWKNYIHGISSEKHDRVNRVAQQILRAARQHCEAQLQEVQKQMNANPSDGIMEKIKFWNEALESLNGNWDCVVTKLEHVNAFVTGSCMCLSNMVLPDLMDFILPVKISSLAVSLCREASSRPFSACPMTSWP
jgi:hypothetical protein